MSYKDLEKKIIKLDPLSSRLDKAGHTGGAGKRPSKPKKYTGSKQYKNLKNLKEGVVVIRGTSKKKDVASTPGNRVNEKYQGRYFFEKAKSKEANKTRILAAKSFAKTNTDPKGEFGVKTVPKKDRLILTTKLTPRELGVSRRLFEKFAPQRNPWGSPSQRQGRYGRLIVPKSALKRLKVDRKLTREGRKENKGGLIQGKPKLAIKGF